MNLQQSLVQKHATISMNKKHRECGPSVCLSASDGRYLKVVLHVAVSVFGDVEEDEEVLTEVVSHRLDPRHTVLRQTELHHLRRRRAGRLNELRRRGKTMCNNQKIISTVYYPTIN